MRMSTIEWIFYILLVVGGLNWGLIGFFDFNLVAELFESESIQRVIYALVGVATIFSLVSTLMRSDARVRDDI